MKIRTGDKVVVITGKDKKVEGEVKKVFKQTNKLIVGGVNIATKHKKPRGGQPGMIVKEEKSIDASNVMLICPLTKKPTKIGFVITGGKKFRFSKVAVKEGKKAEDAII